LNFTLLYINILVQSFSCTYIKIVKLNIIIESSSIFNWRMQTVCMCDPTKKILP